MYYSRNKARIRKIYHVCVWLVAICSMSHCYIIFHMRLIDGSVHSCPVSTGDWRCAWHLLVSWRLSMVCMGVLFDVYALCGGINRMPISAANAYDVDVQCRILHYIRIMLLNT